MLLTTPVSAKENSNKVLAKDKKTTVARGEQ
jgi:hypothetical protein